VIQDRDEYADSSLQERQDNGCSRGKYMSIDSKNHCFTSLYLA